MSLTAFLVLVGDAPIGATLESARQPVMNFLSGLTKQPTETHEQHGALLWQSSVYADESAEAVRRASKDGMSRTVIFDGWVENRGDLIPLLANAGVSDNSTDSELVLAAHMQWGDGAMNQLYGEYSYVLVEQTSVRALPRALAVRDRVGVRPLFYSTWKGGCALSNFPGALPLLPWVGSEINYGYTAEFLLGEINATRETFYAGVTRVIGGHSIDSGIGGAAPMVSRYWMPSRWKIQRDNNTAMKTLRTALESAVNGAIRSRYPIGVQISGGIDSSSVAMLVADAVDQGAINASRVTGMSQVYPGLSCDETYYIDAVEAVLPFSVVRLVPCYANSEQADDWTRRSRYVSFSFAGTSALRHSADHTRRGGRVVLTGEGGDELFIPTAAAIRHAVLEPGGLTAVKKYFVRRWRGRPRTASWLGTLKHVLGDAIGDRVANCLSKHYYRKYRPHFRPFCLEWWLDLKVADRLDKRVALSGLRTVSNAAIWDGWLCESIEHQYWAGFLIGVEKRHPLMSARVVTAASEFSFDLLDGQVDSTRVPLRSVVASRLPNSVLKRTDKAEFTVVVLPALLTMMSRRFGGNIPQYVDLGSRRRIDFQPPPHRFVWQSDLAQSTAFFLDCLARGNDA